MVRRKAAALVLGVVLCTALGLPIAAQTAGQPSAEESTLFSTAQSSGLAADYQAYLAQYPEGVFAEIARFELEWAAKSAGAPSNAALPETSIAPPPAAADTDGATQTMPQSDVSFDGPLTAPGTPVDGKAIAELIKGSPLFAPIEGLPDSVWKDKTCSNCHEWTKEALCTQGGTYSQPTGEGALAKKHPYGGAFKAALKTFAIEGCR